MPAPLMSLDLAVMLAVSVHEGQRDKAGLPYILHPMRVMTVTEERTRMLFTLLQGSRRQALTLRLEACIAAVLHDVLEDANRQQFPRIEEEVAACSGVEAWEAIQRMTRGPGEAWSSYIERVCGHWISRLVKLIDMEHNSDLTRLPQVTLSDKDRLKRYAAAKADILDTAIAYHWPV